MNSAAQTNATLVLKHKVQDWIGNRLRVDFWLYVNKACDIEVLEMIQWFKGKGLFRGSAITGLRVMFSYMHNDIEGIKRELPNLESMIGQGCKDDNTELLMEILRNQRLLLERGITAELPPSPIAALPLTPSTGKQIAAPAFEMPTFDDDDDLPTLKLSTNTSINSAQNLVNCVFGLTH